MPSRLPALKHRDVLGDPACSRLGFDRRLNPVQNRVSVRALQRLEECSRLRMLIECRLEVVRHGHRARRIIGAVPPTVSLGGFNGGQSRGVHLSRCGQPLRALAVPLRPGTPLLARSELLKEGLRIIAPFLPVDPAEAESEIKSLSIGDGLERRGGLRNP